MYIVYGITLRYRMVPFGATIFIKTLLVQQAFKTSEKRYFSHNLYRVYVHMYVLNLPILLYLYRHAVRHITIQNCIDQIKLFI